MVQFVLTRPFFVFDPGSLSRSFCRAPASRAIDPSKARYSGSESRSSLPGFRLSHAIFRNLNLRLVLSNRCQVLTVQYKSSLYCNVQAAPGIISIGIIVQFASVPSLSMSFLRTLPGTVEPFFFSFLISDFGMCPGRRLQGHGSRMV